MQVALFPPRTETPQGRPAAPRERDLIAERVAAAARVRRKRRRLRRGLGWLRTLRRRSRVRRILVAMSARQRAEEPRAQRSLT